MANKIPPNSFDLENTSIGCEMFLASHRLDTHCFACSIEPAPDMLVQILDELNIQPREAVMVGDTEYDLAMAQAAGIDRIGVSFGVHHVDRLNAFAPLTLVDSLTDVLDWV